MNRFLSAWAALMLLFLYLPLALLAAFSFNASRFTVWEGFSLRWYGEVLRDPHLAETAVNSLAIALASTLISTVIGTLCAYGLWKRRDRLVSGGLYLSLVTPEIVMGVSLLAFFQWTFRWLGLQLGMHTVILAHVGFSVAYVVFVVAARLRNFDHALEEAAMDLGATEWQAFRMVTLPSMTPAIISGALLALTVSFDDYVITSLVAGVDSETLPMWMYSAARRGPNPVLNAIASIVVVVFGALILISERLRKAV